MAWATRRGFPPWLFAALCAVVAHTARGDTNEVRAPLPFARYSNDQIQPLRTDAPVDGVTQWLASLSITNGLSAAKRRDLSQAAELLVLGTWLKADQLPVLISLAEVYQELLQHKKALNAWRLALKAAPQDPYAWEGLATALEANWDDANADLAKHATVHLINGEPIPEACLELLKAPCQAEVPALRTVEWLYELAVQHGLRALRQRTPQAASDILHTAANLLPERAGELPSVIHSAFGETDLALGSLVTLLGAGATRDSRTGVLMAQHAERQNNTDSDSAQLARELYMIVLGLSAPSPAAAAADPLKYCMAPMADEEAVLQASRAQYCVVAALGADRLEPLLTPLALLQAATTDPLPPAAASLLPAPLRVTMLMRAGEQLEADAHEEPVLAFAAYMLAQEIHARHQNHTAALFDMAREETVGETSRRLMNATWLAELGAASETPSQAQPIFVVSVPHGGADVVEALLHAHDAVAAVPVTHGDFLTLGIANVSDVEGMASTPRTELEAVGSTYLARRRAAVDAALTASGASKEAPRFTDAAPRNYPLLGVALAALPHAHAVWVRTDARDSCVRALRRVGDGAKLGQYATLPANLTACGRQAQVQDELMAHWAALFPARVHTVSLAEVARSPLAAYQQLATALKLNDGHNDGACASPEQLDGIVAAAKAAQGGWRRFAGQMEFAFAPLNYVPPMYGGR